MQSGHLNCLDNSTVSSADKVCSVGRMSQKDANTISPANRAFLEQDGPRAFVSYASDTVKLSVESKDPIGRLCNELRLRGFKTFRDTASIRVGQPNEDTIFEALADADVYMPVIDEHFLASDFCREEFRFANSPETKPENLIVVPIIVGLGYGRDEVAGQLWDALRYDVGAYWTNPSPSALNSGHALDAAREALTRILPKSAEGGPLRIGVVTRGSARGAGFVIDGSEIFGESAVEVGDCETWEMLATSIADVERALRAHTDVRDIELELNCHLAAGMIAGFTFRENAGWRVTINDRAGLVEPSDELAGSLVTSKFEASSFSGTGGRVAVGVDLVGRLQTDDVRAIYPEPPRGYIWAIEGGGVVKHSLDAIAPSANDVAAAIRSTGDRHKVDAFDLCLATPVSFAVLLGTRLGSICAPVALYDWDKKNRKYELVYELEEE